MHPDYSERTTGALAADFNSPTITYSNSSFPYKSGGPSTSSATNFDYSDYVFFAECEELFEAAITEFKDDPKTITQARSHINWPKWQEAMDKEIITLEKAGTWITVPRPIGKNIVGSKWVFHIKQKANRAIEKYKVCLVVRGFTQKFRIDYFDTFSPVARCHDSDGKDP
jgi:hypothetical protein